MWFIFDHRPINIHNCLIKPDKDSGETITTGSHRPQNKLHQVKKYARKNKGKIAIAGGITFAAATGTALFAAKKRMIFLKILDKFFEL